MHKLIEALGNDIREVGRSKWMAKCPVHGDKDFAMSIKQANDGSVLAHCFACGANGLDLYKHLNLPLEELMGNKEKPDNLIPTEIREAYELDKAVLKIAEHDKIQGRQISYKDKNRIKLAKARIKGIESKFPELAQ